MKQQLEDLIFALENKYVKRLEGSELIQAYYGQDEAHDFSDWASGNFDDDVDLGNRLGCFEVAEEVIEALKNIINYQ